MHQLTDSERRHGYGDPKKLRSHLKMEYFQELSEQLKENGVNPADFLDSFNDILKKNDVSITDMGKAALLQKAAAAAGIDASAFSVLLGKCSLHVFTNPDFSICLFRSAWHKN